LIALPFVVNLATDMVRVDAPWWTPAVWTMLGVLVAVVGRVEWTRARAVRESTVDHAVTLDRAVDDLAEVVARQWRGEVNVRGLGHVDPIRIR
jgi:hypothetical protein